MGRDGFQCLDAIKPATTVFVTHLTGQVMYRYSTLVSVVEEVC